jgi:hypothetical protein
MKNTITDARRKRKQEAGGRIMTFLNVLQAAAFLGVSV